MVLRKIVFKHICELMHESKLNLTKLIVLIRKYMHMCTWSVVYAQVRTRLLYSIVHVSIPDLYFS